MALGGLAVLPMTDAFSEDDLNRGLNEALGLYRQGDCRGALAMAEEICRRKPDHPNLLFFMGFLHLVLGNPEETKKLLFKSLALLPDYDSALLEAAKILESSDEYPSSLRFFERFLYLVPENGNALLDYSRTLFNYGNHAYREKNYPLARDLFRKALGINPELEHAEYNLNVAEFEISLKDGTLDKFYTDRVREMSSGVKLFFDLNNGCNLDCVMCGSSEKKPLSGQDVMNIDAFRDRCGDVFSLIADFQFGCMYEPLALPYFNQSLELIAGKLKPGVKGSIISNGMLLTMDKIAAVVDSGIFSVFRFSFDAAKRDVFEQIRRKANFDRIVSNIGKLVDYRNEMNSPMRIGLNFTLMPYNAGELPGVVAMAHQLGLDMVTTHKFSPHDYKYVSEDVYRLYETALSVAEDIASRTKISFRRQTYRLKAEYESCLEMCASGGINGVYSCGYADTFRLRMDCTGNIYPFCNLTDNLIGSIEDNSFEEILSSEYAFRLIYVLSHPETKSCLTCHLFDRISGQ